MVSRRLANISQTHRMFNTLTDNKSIPATPEKPATKSTAIPGSISEFHEADKTLFPRRKRKSRNRKLGFRDSASIESHPTSSSSTNDIDELQAHPDSSSPAGTSSQQAAHAGPARTARIDCRQAGPPGESSDDEMLNSKRTRISEPETQALSDRKPKLHRIERADDAMDDRSAITLTNFKASSAATSPLAVVETPVPTKYEFKFLVHGVVIGANHLNNFHWGLSSLRASDLWPIYPDSGDLSWLRIRLEKLQQVKYNESSPFVILDQSAGSGLHPKIGIKFDTPDHAQSFIDTIGRTGYHPTNTRTNPETLDKTFRQFMIQARELQQRQSAIPKLPQPTILERNLKTTKSLSSLKATPVPIPKPGTRIADTEGLTSVRQTRSSGPPATPEGLGLDHPKRSTRFRYISPEITFKWTEENPRWKERWIERLEYPQTGKNRATVDAEDIPRLDEGQWLNDNIILCYINYLKKQRDLREPNSPIKIHFMNSFFHHALKPDRPCGPIKYDAVKSWTSNIDIFSYDYIVVPVNENAHWYLAIISHPGKLLAKVKAPVDADEEVVFGTKKSAPINFDTPRVWTLDSLGSTHPVTARILRQYLAAEMNTRHDTDVTDFVAMGTTVKNCPRQENGCDCGVFVLGFIEALMEDPTGFITSLAERQPVKCNFSAPQLRNKIRDTLFKLQEEQVAQNKIKLEQRRQEKLKRKQQKLAAQAEAQAAESAVISSTHRTEEPQPKSAVATPLKPVITTSQSPSTPFPVAAASLTTESDKMHVRSRSAQASLEQLTNFASSPLKSRMNRQSPSPSGDTHKRKRSTGKILPSIEQTMEKSSNLSNFGVLNRLNLSTPTGRFLYEDDVMDIDNDLPAHPSLEDDKPLISPGSDTEVSFSVREDSEMPEGASSKAQRLSYLHNTTRGNTPAEATVPNTPVVVDNDDDDDEIQEMGSRPRQPFTALNSFSFSVPSGRDSHYSRHARSSPGPTDAPLRPFHRFSINVPGPLSEEMSEDDRPTTAGSFSDYDRRPTSSGSLSGNKTQRLKQYFGERDRRPSLLSGRSERLEGLTKTEGPQIIRTYADSHRSRKRSATVTERPKDIIEVVDIT